VTNAYGTSAALDPTGLKFLTIAQVFAKVESSGDGIVGLSNTNAELSSKPVTISTTAAAMGLPADAKGYEVQDLWGNESVAAGGRSSDPPARTAGRMRPG